MEVLRLTLCGSAFPAVVREGFCRSWRVAVVTDMWEEVAAASVSATIRARPCGAAVTATLDGQRLTVSVQRAPHHAAFDLLLEAEVPGCALVLPLEVGPIEILEYLPKPMPMAEWSRVIPLRPSATVRVHEAQDCNSVIASSTWDPGVVLATWLAEQAEAAASGEAAGDLGRVLQDHTQPLRCIEVGAGCGVTGLAFAALAHSMRASAGIGLPTCEEEDAGPRVRVALTDSDPRACALARRNILANGLSKSMTACQLSWGVKADGRAACDAIGGPPHVIIAADVVYREETFGPLVATLAELASIGTVSQEPPIVLFAYRHRVDDKHFWCKLSEEFDIHCQPCGSHSRNQSPPPAARSPEAADPTGGNGMDQSTAGYSYTQQEATSDHKPTQRGEPAIADGSKVKIFRLVRRPVRKPSGCRTCGQRTVLHSTAQAAIAAHALSRFGV